MQHDLILDDLTLEAIRQMRLAGKRRPANISLGDWNLGPRFAPKHAAMAVMSTNRYQCDVASAFRTSRTWTCIILSSSKARAVIEECYKAREKAAMRESLEVHQARHRAEQQIAEQQLVLKITKTIRQEATDEINKTRTPRRRAKGTKREQLEG